MELDLEPDRDGRVTLPLAGCDVVMLRVDYMLTLVIDHALGTFEVWISSGFSYDSGGGRVDLDPDARPQGLGPVLTLARTSVVEAFASADGALSIAFADGTRIEVPPDPAFEAWGMGGPGGMRVISTPGGELAVWKYLPRP